MKMSKKSFAGRLVIFPWFLCVVLTEFSAAWLAEKLEAISTYSRKHRRKIEAFADEKYPAPDGKKTNL